MSSRPSLRDFELDLTPEDKGENSVVFLPDHIRAVAPVQILYPYFQFPVDVWANQPKPKPNPKEKIHIVQTETRAFFQSPIRANSGEASQSVRAAHPMLTSLLMTKAVNPVTIAQNDKMQMPVAPIQCQFQPMRPEFSAKSKFQAMQLKPTVQSKFQPIRPEPETQSTFQPMQLKPTVQNKFQSMHPEPETQKIFKPIQLVIPPKLGNFYDVSPKVCQNGKPKGGKRGPKPVPKPAFKLDLYPLIQDVEPPFKCLICKRIFKNQRGVRRHYTVLHAPRRNFLCRTCNATFTSECSLRRHVRTIHLNIRHRCSFCGKAFSLMHYRDFHMKTVHQEEFRGQRNNYKKIMGRQFWSNVSVDLKKKTGRDECGE